MCLALPQRQLCDINCPGILTDNSGESSEQGIDNRWSGLKALKKQLPG